MVCQETSVDQDVCPLRQRRFWFPGCRASYGPPPLVVLLVGGVDPGKEHRLHVDSRAFWVSAIGAGYCTLTDSGQGCPTIFS
jgi:hypothetical protein